MGFSYYEAYNIPVWQRNWFIRRINQEFEKAKDGKNVQSKAAHTNTPEARGLMGNQRAHVPAKLRRFT